MNWVFICLTFGVLLEVAQSESIESPNRANVKSAADCQVCEYIIKFIRFQTLDQRQTVNAVKEKLKALFKIIPSSAQNEEYLSNVEKYVKMIRNGMYPKSICKLLSKCSIKQLDMPRITECEVCTAVVDLIKFELTISNATVEVIIKAVEALCAILGDVPVYEECKLILKELNQIIQWIEEQLTPEDICVKLGFCNKTLTSDYLITQALLGKSSSSILCDLCTMVVNMVDNKLKDLDIELNVVETELDDICNALGDFAQQCKSVVDLVLDQIKKTMENIETKLDPSATCKSLQLCPKSNTKI